MFINSETHEYVVSVYYFRFIQTLNKDKFTLSKASILHSQLADMLTWLKSLSLMTWDIKPWIASIVVLQLKIKSFKQL